jgi:inorganic pyrophosphatase
MVLTHLLKPGRDPPDEVNVVIEIPKGSSIKYEIDAESGAVFVDRKLFTSMVYPYNYGFIPQTKEGDGDPVDVLVLGNDPVIPLSVIRARPIGVLLTEDEEGQDSKIIAVPLARIDPSYSAITDIHSIPEYTQSQIEHFFEHYKELEKGKFVKVLGWEGKEVAKRKISDAVLRFSRNHELDDRGINLGSSSTS